MAIVRVTANDGKGTSSAVFGGTPTAGNLLLCLVLAYDASGSGVISAAGFTLITSYPLYPTIPYRIGLLAKSSAGTEGTVTPAITGGGTVYDTSVCEYSGVANPYAQDGTAAGSNSANSGVSTLATAAISTTYSDSLIFTVGAFTTTGSTPTMSWTTAGSDFIAKTGATTAIGGGQYLPGTTKSGYTDTLQVTFIGKLATIIAGFRAAPSGYTVTFNANGGTGSLASEGPYSVATALSLFSTGTMAYAGYLFTGWNTAADGTGTAYADGASYPFSANATLYAQWALVHTATIINEATPGFG